MLYTMLSFAVKTWGYDLHHDVGLGARRATANDHVILRQDVSLLNTALIKL
jgi:hypothetical protein